MKILAIDDQKLVLLPLKKRLESLGYEVVTENSALTGIEQFDFEVSIAFQQVC